MTALLLAEEIFLLAYNEESGKANGTLALDNGLAGALLLDLAADELVAADGRRSLPWLERLRTHSWLLPTLSSSKVTSPVLRSTG
jgi:hypothetical protein